MNMHLQKCYSNDQIQIECFKILLNKIIHSKTKFSFENEALIFPLISMIHFTLRVQMLIFEMDKSKSKTKI